MGPEELGSVLTLAFSHDGEELGGAVLEALPKVHRPYLGMDDWVNAESRKWFFKAAKVE